MKSNFATVEATAKLKDRHSKKGNNSAFRDAQSLSLSSIGIGTYLGNWDEATDKNYTGAVSDYVRRGGNVIDTAANYRFQRSERAIGSALKSLGNEVDRSALFIASKAGYLSFDSEPVSDVRDYFDQNFVKKGIAGFDDLVGGSHCLAPNYLLNQIDQSITNMGIDGIDLFYLHNPESQLAEVDRYTFEARVANAFEALEQARADSRINFYGVASWEGFRVAPDADGYHSLERFVDIAKQVGGDENGFKFIQLPHNLAMPEAYIIPNQAVNGKARPAIGAAGDLGLSVMASASLLQGQLTMNVPMHIRETLGNLTTDAMSSLQFVRSTPGVTTALVGMSSVQHVEENMKLTQIAATNPEVYTDLFSKRKNA